MSNNKSPFKPDFDFGLSKEVQKMQKQIESNLRLFSSQVSVALSFDAQQKLDIFKDSINSANRTYLLEFQKSMHSIYEPIMQTMNRIGQMMDSNRLMLQTEASHLLSEFIRAYKSNFAIEDFIAKQFCDNSDWQNLAPCEDDIAEVYKDLEVAAESPNWQQEIAKNAKKWKNKNPVIYFFLVFLLLPMLMNLFCNYITGATKNKTILRAKPQINSSIIYNIKDCQNIMIVDGVPYYYKVELKDTTTGETITGWISKRNVKLNDEFKIDEIINEEEIE